MTIGALIGHANPSNTLIIENFTMNGGVSLKNEFEAEQTDTYHRYVGCVIGKMDGGSIELNHANVTCNMVADIYGTTKSFSVNFNNPLLTYIGGFAGSINASGNIQDLQLAFVTDKLSVKGFEYENDPKEIIIDATVYFGGFFGYVSGLSATKPLNLDRAICTINEYDVGLIRKYIEKHSRIRTGSFAGAIKYVTARNFIVDIPDYACGSYHCGMTYSVLAPDVENSTIANFDIRTTDFYNQVVDNYYTIKDDKIINGYVPTLEQGGYGDPFPSENYYGILFHTSQSFGHPENDSTRKLYDATRYTADKVVKFFNDILASKHKSFPAGKYLPWISVANGSKSRATLKFDAADSELITIP